MKFPISIVGALCLLSSVSPAAASDLVPFVERCATFEVRVPDEGFASLGVTCNGVAKHIGAVGDYEVISSKVSRSIIIVMHYVDRRMFVLVSPGKDGPSVSEIGSNISDSVYGNPFGDLSLVEIDRKKYEDSGSLEVRSKIDGKVYSVVIQKI